MQTSETNSGLKGPTSGATNEREMSGQSGITRCEMEAVLCAIQHIIGGVVLIVHFMNSGARWRKDPWWPQPPRQGVACRKLNYSISTLLIKSFCKLTTGLGVRTALAARNRTGEYDLLEIAMRRRRPCHAGCGIMSGAFSPGKRRYNAE